MTSTRSLELAISASNIKDQIASLLYTMGYVCDNEEILHLDIKGFKGDIVPIRVTIKKDRLKQEVTVTDHK